MSNFEIYVKTSALGKTGIHWRRIESEERQLVEVPSLIKHQVIGEENGQITIVNDLIDEVKPSLLIFRDKNGEKLLLEITGIESPQRSIRLGRKVFNSMVWIADDIEENEVVLRKIAYSAIQNILQKDFSLSEMIEKSVEFYGLEEFRVNLKEINEYIGHIQPVDSHHFSDIESYQEYQIEHKSSESLDKLAEELQNYALPKQWVNWDGETKNDGVLIVVTENLEKRTILHKAGVWRGFATNVEEPAKVVELQEKKTKTLPPVETLPAEQTQIPHQPISTPWRIIIMLIVGIIVILFIILGFPSPVQAPHQPEKNPQLYLLR
ncbi:hypothetical protein OGM63_02065 [Plectonema radiosum NIES-515]|uniref:Uncharacterized protein n=1 Tax=Plectonema radiosum NIES-515 TaxID=2986073 RepID=A0ABT3AUB4_9CYAN|nr:hypothetical protein [Plectonema radiosum]MCV3212325.1 hypothetical protein [Plectonema radiosum NIES-515]